MPTDIFISYSRKDTEFADKLASSLTSHGYTVWIDRGGIDAGMSWRRQIVDAINGSRLFLLILSPNSIVSDNVVKELDIADTSKKAKLPVIYQTVQVPDDMQYQLAGLQFQDFSSGDFGSNLDRLNHALTRLGLQSSSNSNTVTPQPSAPSRSAPKTGFRLPFSRRILAIIAGAVILLCLGIFVLTSGGGDNSGDSSNDPVLGLHSQNSSNAVKLVIDNQMSQALLLYWVDFKGNEQSFSSIDSMTAVTQDTFETHVWRLRDPAGKEIATYVVKADAVQRIQIGADGKILH